MTVAKEEQKITTEDLGRLPINQLLHYYMMPAIVSSLVSALYNIVDRIFIGQFVSGLAMAGLAVTFPVLMLLQAIGVLIGVGASSRISIMLGQGRKEEAEKLLGTAFLVQIIITVIVLALMFPFLDQILLAFGASSQTLPYAREYLVIVVPFNIFSKITYFLSGVMRSTGHPRKSMNVNILGAGLNIVLDAVFVLGFGMGIDGVAFATGISMLVTAIYSMEHFFNKKESEILLRTRNFRWNTQYVKDILTIGVAPFAVHVTASLVSYVKNTSLLRFGGDYAIGAYGVVNSISTLILMGIFGMSIAMQPIVGYNYGANNIPRVREAYLRVRRINVIIGLVGTLLAFFFPYALARIFTNDPNILVVTEVAVRIELAALWAVGFQVTTGQFFQSIGYANQALILSLSRQFLFLIPLIYGLPRLGMGLNGIWWASPIADTLSLLLAIYFIRKFIRRHDDWVPLPDEDGDDQEAVA